MATAKQGNRPVATGVAALALQRRKELDKFFSGMQALEDYSAGKIPVLPPQVLEDEFIKIVKASSFLLLYNYVEGCATEAFLSIYRTIESEGLEYSDLCAELRKIWVDYKAKPLFLDPSSCHDAYKQFAMDLVDSVVQQNLVIMNRKAIPVSGNLNEKKLKAVCEAHGIKLHSKTSKVEDDLQIVLSKRNDLAHGSTSFAECGREYVVADLERIKVNALQYIDLFLQSVTTYIHQKRYGA